MRVHVITSCTDRKRVEVPGDASIRSIAATELEARVDSWLRIVTAEERERHLVRDVYGGEHWTEFLGLLDEDGSGPERLGWVISAGYGLLPLKASISGYSATFSVGHDDSVRPADVEWDHRDWWRAIAEWKVPDMGEPRSILGIAQECGQDDQIVCAASYGYLKAVQEDLVAAAEAIQDPGRVLVLGANVPSPLKAHPLVSTPDYDSSLQAVVDGSRIGLNIRVARFALQTYIDGTVGEHAGAVLSEAMAHAPPPPSFDRRPAEDDEVIAFIRRSLLDSPGESATVLLRAWRTRGRACEQGRFRRLFKAARQEHQSSLLDMHAVQGSSIS